MKTELIKRTFEAANFPKESEERSRLNMKNITSEYMTSKKFIVRIHKEETATHNAYYLDRTFSTKTEAENYIKDIQGIS